MDSFFDRHNLGLEVERIETTAFTSGDSGHVVYTRLINRSTDKIQLEIEEMYMINCQSQQFDSDSWLTGHVNRETSIRNRSYKTTAPIFYDTRFTSIEPGFMFGIVVKDKTHGERYDACFVLSEDGEWTLLECNVSKCESEMTPAKIQQKLNESLERLEIFEEKLGVRLDNVSVKVNDNLNTLWVFGELYSTEGDMLSESVQINVNLYGKDGTIIEKEDRFVNDESFLGYESFKIQFFERDIALLTNKVRIYVTRS